MAIDRATADFIRAATRLGYRTRTGRKSHVKLYDRDDRLVTTLPCSTQREGKHLRIMRTRLVRAGYHDLAALL